MNSHLSHDDPLLIADRLESASNVRLQHYKSSKCDWFQRRYCVCLLCCIGLFNVYAMRVNLSVAIEPMACEFNWNPFTQGLVLSAFFAGYLFGNIPGGYLADKYGGKIVFGLGVLCTALLTAILPMIASGSLQPNDELNCWCSNESEWCFSKGTYTNTNDQCLTIRNTHSACDAHSYLYLLIVLRFFMGLCESVTFPAMYSLLNNWSPKNERSRMVAISISGSYIGNILGFPISSFIIASESHIYGGWKNVFYFFSICGALWWIAWLCFVFDSPFTDPYISRKELQHLREELPASLLQKYERNPTIQCDKNETYFEWKPFFTEPAALALYIAHFSYHWSFYTLLTELPTYLNDELNFKLSSAGFISVVPYTSQLVLCIIASICVDKVIMNGLVTRTHARILIHAIGSIIPGVLLVICGYLNDSTYVVVLLSVSTGLMGVTTSGYSANYADVSPTLSSIMYGISNTFATLPGIISPILSGYILSGDNKKSEWKLIFYIACFVFVIGTMLYWLLGTAEVVPSLNLKQKHAQLGRDCKSYL
eukprot:222386_1